MTVFVARLKLVFALPLSSLSVDLARLPPTLFQFLISPDQRAGFVRFAIPQTSFRCDGKSKSTYGYKAHVNVDEDEDGLIKSIGYTVGNVHDSNCFTELLDGEESSVYADSAYSRKKYSEWLEDRNIDNRIIKRADRNKPLTENDKCFNRLHSGVRCTVE